MNTITDKKKNPDQSKKSRSTGFRILKYFLIGSGICAISAISFIAWIYFALFSGPGPMEMNDFHPFRSAKANAQYLAYEDTMVKSWPLASEERLVQTSFGKTFMRISGPAGAPPLVLVPGGGANSLIWHANIQALSQDYRTYALDNIYDYGKSIYMREIKSGKDYSDWLNELFDTLHVGNDIRIIGYSYGGWVTGRFALDHPERLTHVALIAPIYTVFPLPGDYIKRMITTLIPVRYFKSKIMYWVWSDLAKMGEKGRQLVEDRIDYYQLALKSFKFKQSVNPVVFTDMELQKLRMPVLFLVGEHETAFNAGETIERLNKVNPLIKTDLIPNTGHDLMFTHTEMVNKLILDFLGN
jgi:pimeloyl-ACP methyl ester carboxylesterase